MSRVILVTLGVLLHFMTLTAKLMPFAFHFHFFFCFKIDFKVVSINEEGLKMTEELTKTTGHPIR